MATRQMELTTFGLTEHGVRVQVSSRDSLMAVDLDRESAVNHAAAVLALAGITRLSFRPDGSYLAEAP